MMRDKIAAALMSASTGNYGDQADAIIAALPDMIPDLGWVTPSPTTDGQWQDASGVYDIEESILFIGHVETGIRYPNDKEAKAAANAHHRAAIMAAFGVAS